MVGLILIVIMDSSQQPAQRRTRRLHFIITIRQSDNACTRPFIHLALITPNVITDIRHIAVRNFYTVINNTHTKMLNSIAIKTNCVRRTGHSITTTIFNSAEQ